jgi:hypothetical protein
MTVEYNGVVFRSGDYIMVKSNCSGANVNQKYVLRNFNGELTSVDELDIDHSPLCSCVHNWIKIDEKVLLKDWFKNQIYE